MCNCNRLKRSPTTFSCVSTFSLPRPFLKPFLGSRHLFSRPFLATLRNVTKPYETFETLRNLTKRLKPYETFETLRNVTKRLKPYETLRNVAPATCNPSPSRSPCAGERRTLCLVLYTHTDSTVRCYHLALLHG